ncbi:MAG: DUF1553 domain-containing protein [Planctomycetota bacterium]|nr:DUF1553 domain-containing protein [Planctomycetota bacterium]
MRWLARLSLSVVLAAASEAASAEPLHAKIDQLIESQATGVEIAPSADDAEFLRRVSLDLAGRIPTVAEANAFLSDKAEDKRSVLIEKLLTGPDYPRRMQELFHVMLMERRGDNDEWLKFLRVCFEQNKPWHVMARAILNPDADNDELRGAAFFVTQRLVSEGAMAPVDVPGLTRDVGRLLAGVDLQCAQCHNHLTIPHYYQKDFQGLHMIFENVQTRRDVQFPAVSEKVMQAKKEFKSVFEQVALQTGPVVPGRGEVEIPVFEKGEEFAVAADPKTRKPGVPKFSPLNELATGLAAKENDIFTKNIVNRLWFVMMGRGLVEPLDLQHADNAPTHPELLNLLASEFVAHEFDIRWLLGELARTNTYQRSSMLPGEAEPPRESYAVAIEKRVSAEQLYWSVGIATGRFDAVRRSIRKGLVDAKKPEEEIKTIDEATLEELVAKSDELKTALADFKTNFGSGPKEPEVEFEPSVKGALYLMHESKLQKCLESGSATLVEDLLKTETDQAAIDHLFLRLLTRKPTDEERQQLASYLEENKERRSEALANVAWAMLTSTEFVVNH